MTKTEYVPVTFQYGPKRDPLKYTVSFFIPVSFIKDGDLNGWTLSPDNFLGVNLKAVLEEIEK